MARLSSKGPLDLTLYLVTDENPAYLAGRNLARVVEEAIEGGVTIVQYRQKTADTAERIQAVTKVLEVTRRHKVPLLINDDIDTCLAIGAEGVHIGQDDMSLQEAREKLGPNAIIGVSAASIEEANAAIEGGADYLGIGTVFATPTKTDTKSIIGTRGTQLILEACDTGTKRTVPCVAIGGLNAHNIQRVLHQSANLSNRLNGAAIVSAIMASPDPKASAHEIKALIASSPTTLYASTPPSTHPPLSLPTSLALIPSIIAKHATSDMICHNMTNSVVQNFAANVCLATGSSPIMSLAGVEAADLASLSGALVINIGTLIPTTISAFIAGLAAYNRAGNPVLFDPVGGGATALRRETIQTLMAAGFFDIIKGNEGEITAVIGATEVKQRGVDSGPTTTTPSQKAAMVKTLALREHCIVLMTGAVDYISDGTRTLTISNGSHWLGKITGSGCALGSVVASYVAVHKADKLVAALAGILHYEIAAERAEGRAEVRGPGSFIPAFLDELYLLGQELKDRKGLDGGLGAMAKVELVSE